MQQQASTYADRFSMVRDGWVPMLVAVAVFVAQDHLMGIASGGAPVGGVAGAAVLAGHALFRQRPDLSLPMKHLALAGITALLAIPAILVLHLAR